MGNVVGVKALFYPNERGMRAVAERIYEELMKDVVVERGGEAQVASE